MIAVSLLLAAGQAAASDQKPFLPSPYFDKCAVAGRKLWGTSLCAPVVVVEADGSWTSSEPQDATLPATRANTAFDWNGRKWVMLQAPLPTDKAKLDSLLFHEAFHAHQDALGLPAVDALAGHVDDLNGRVLLRLEWKALAAALRSSSKARVAHIRQALNFRAKRLRLYPNGAKLERAQMRNEGLANYTGIRLSADARDRALEVLANAPGNSTLARSFAYASGPAWGLLLDDVRPAWKKRLKGGADLPDLMPFAPSPRSNERLYGGAEIRREEGQAFADRDGRLREALKRTDPATALTLPLTTMRINFNPNQVMVAADGSKIYFGATLSDTWGQVTLAQAPIRIAADGRTAWVPWPIAATDGLSLDDSWTVVGDGSARQVRSR